MMPLNLSMDANHYVWIYLNRLILVILTFKKNGKFVSTVTFEVAVPFCCLFISGIHFYYDGFVHARHINLILPQILVLLLTYLTMLTKVKKNFGIHPVIWIH